MADSENSRTLPAITRRKLLLVSGAGATGVLLTDGEAIASRNDAGEATALTLSLYKDWLIANASYRRIHQECTDIRADLTRDLPDPEVKIMLPNGSAAWATSDEEIDAHLSNWPQLAWLRASLRSQLFELSYRWTMRISIPNT